MEKAYARFLALRRKVMAGIKNALESTAHASHSGSNPKTDVRHIRTNS